MTTFFRADDMDQDDPVQPLVGSDDELDTDDDELDDDDALQEDAELGNDDAA